MIRNPKHTLMATAALVALAVCLAVPAAGLSAPTAFVRLAAVKGGSAPEIGIARTSDGVLHLLWPSGGNGLATRSIGPSGSLGQQVQALSGWQAGLPGLVAMPGGTLEAVFGAISPGNVSSVWGITSNDGGLTWTAPAEVKGGGPNEALAYGSDVTAVLTGTTPVLTLPQAGNLFVQQGLGLGMPSAQINDSAHGSLGNVSTAVDAASGEAVASWQSLNANADVIQGVAPAVGSPQVVPGQSRTSLVLAGRDTGAGVFGAYTADGAHVRLLRYGGGSVAVGALVGVTPKVLGVATGLDGRIWVMWGDDDHGVAVTRSNKAVTRFEAIQHVLPHSFTLWRLAGDGRLGPLDLIVDQTPTFKGSAPPPEALWTRVLPLLTMSVSSTPVKNKGGQIVAVKVTTRVTDAGDPVAGATVALAGQKKQTSSLGIATITVPGGPGTVVETVTATGYQTLTAKVHD